MTITVNGIDGLKARAGEHLGYSKWMEVAQDRINTFAEATGDHQWIHTDPERASAGPYGTAIAHGYLTLSLLIPLWSELLEVRGVAMSINYGLNKVRFPAPVPAGSKIRLSATLAAVNEVPGGAEAIVDAILECEGAAKPACVAQAIYRFYS